MTKERASQLAGQMATLLKEMGPAGEIVSGGEVLALIDKLDATDDEKATLMVDFVTASVNGEIGKPVKSH